MASAVTLTQTTTGDLINVKGVVLEGVTIEPRPLQHRTTKYWGVHGESRINGGRGGRQISIPLLIYDATDFDTARKLADYIDYTLNTTGLEKNGTLDIVSEADHSKFTDCTFEGAMLSPGDSIKHDEAGTLGGGYFALCLLQFRQLTDGAAEV